MNEAFLCSALTLVLVPLGGIVQSRCDEKPSIGVENGFFVIAFSFFLHDKGSIDAKYPSQLTIGTPGSHSLGCQCSGCPLSAALLA